MIHGHRALTSLGMLKETKDQDRSEGFGGETQQPHLVETFPSDTPARTAMQVLGYAYRFLCKTAYYLLQFKNCASSVLSPLKHQAQRQRRYVGPDLHTDTDASRSNRFHI